jgi:hypothetical protein
MRMIKTLDIIIFLLCASLISGQVIESEKVYFQIPSREEKPAEPVPDTEKPHIEIYSPVLDDNYFETDESEIPLIGKIKDNVGIESMILNSEFLKLSESGQFAERLELLPGENIIIIGAMDVNNNFVEKRFIVHYKPAKVSLAEKVRLESIYYALIIGIDNYSDPAINSLDNAMQDAQDLYDILINKYTFDKDNIQFLKDAKREEIIYALDYLSRQVTPDDNLLIFYAGHGIFDEEANIGYWLPSNARKITTADWFANSQLVDYIKRINSKHTLLITDACFGGSIFKMRAAFADAPLAIEKLYELPSRKAMTSGTLTAVPDKSPFAKYLIERLENNKEQYYSAEQLFSSLKFAVINNSDAVPQYGEIRNVGDQGGDFIFIKK